MTQRQTPEHHAGKPPAVGATGARQLPRPAAAAGTGGQKPATQPSPKRVYTSPVLVRWGTLRELTFKIGKNGHLDGGKKVNQTKTR